MRFFWWVLFFCSIACQYLRREERTGEVAKDQVSVENEVQERRFETNKSGWLKKFSETRQKNDLVQPQKGARDVLGSNQALEQRFLVKPLQE